MSEFVPNVEMGLADSSGVIRYDWPQIQLLITAGVSYADAAKELTKDCPERYETVRNTIAVRAMRYEWKQVAENARKLARNDSGANTGHPSKASEVQNALSNSVIAYAANIASERKNRYLDVTTAFIDKAAKQLQDHPVQSLQDASIAAKLMEPVHKIAVDVHGLNAKESPASLQVNVLSQGATEVSWGGSEESKQE